MNSLACKIRFENLKNLIIYVVKNNHVTGKSIGIYNEPPSHPSLDCIQRLEKWIWKSQLQHEKAGKETQGHI